MAWLTDCHVVDVRSGDVHRRSSVEIEGGRIKRVESGNPPLGADSTSLDGLYLLPGLISCHVHLSVVYPFSRIDPREPQATTVLRAAKRARDALYAGVTTIRCVHEQHGVDLYLREAAAAGWVEAPRILAGGHGISVTGGHGSHFAARYANGADSFLAAVRREIATGADHVKVFITGGIAASGENLEMAQMTAAEMAAAVRAVTEHHKYVVAHAASAAAIRQALEAGIKSFEHGYLLDEATARLMAESGAILSPTLSVTRSPDWMRAHSFTEWQVDRALEAGPEHLASVRKAIQAGVPLVNGTDYAPGEPHDGTSVVVREMEYMVDAGLTPLQSLQASTMNGARLCNIEQLVGAIDPGLAADLIAVENDPTQDVGAMRTIRFVMQAGRVIRSDRVSLPV